ncbi:MAG: hypothetical protein ACKO85_10395 [Isosphaeraceae bacterium]
MSTVPSAGRPGVSLEQAGSWRGFVLAFLYLVPPIVYFCLGAVWLYEKGYLLYGIGGWISFTIVFSVLARLWLKDATKILPPLDWEKPWTFAPRDAQAWQLVQDAAARGSDLSLDALSRMETYQQATEDLARSVAACYYPKVENPLEKVPIIDLIVAVELAAEDLEALCRQVPAMDQLTPGHLKGLTKAIGYAQTANELYNFALPVFRPVTGLPRLVVQKLVAEPAWRQTKEGVQRWLYKAYINRLGMHLVELSSGRLRAGSAAYRKAAREKYQGAESAVADTSASASHDTVAGGTKAHRELKLTALMPGLSTKAARERLGLWSHLAESSEYQVAELLNLRQDPMAGVSFLPDVCWAAGTWPGQATDILNENVQARWQESARVWLEADLLLFDLRELSAMHQLETAETVTNSLSQAYLDQPDWPVAPILIVTESIDDAEIRIPANLSGEVHFSRNLPQDDIKSEIGETNGGHELSPELATLAELARVLPLARQRQLARELAGEARQSGIRRVAGQVAQAAGRAGVELISGWLSRRATPKSEDSTSNQSPS